MCIKTCLSLAFECFYCSSSKGTHFYIFICFFSDYLFSYYCVCAGGVKGRGCYSWEFGSISIFKSFENIPPAVFRPHQFVGRALSAHMHSALVSYDCKTFRKPTMVLISIHVFYLFVFWGGYGL